MKKIFTLITISIALLVCGSLSSAQDSRQRAPETIVQDILALVPADNQATLEAELHSLVATAPRSLEILTSMLKPSDSGANAKVEYVIHALAQYASDPANSYAVEAVRKCFDNAADNSEDAYNKAFFLQELRLVAYKDAPAVVQPATSPDPARPAYSKKDFLKLDLSGQRDAIYWIGETRDASQIDLVTFVLGKSRDEGLVGDAAIAASKIGGEKAASALVNAVTKGSAASAAVREALLSFNGDIAPAVMAALNKAKGSSAASLIEIAGLRHIKPAFEIIYAFTGSKDGNVAAAARRALKGVATEGNADTMADLLDAGTNDVKNYQEAYQAALNFIPAENRFETIAARMKNASNPQNFFPALAATGADEAVDALKGELDGKYRKEAVAALAVIDNFKAAEPLFNAASADKSLLVRYLELVETYQDKGERLADYEKALFLSGDDADIRLDALAKIAGLETPEAFVRVAGFIDDAGIAKPVADLLVSMAPKIASVTDYEVFKGVIAKVNAVNAAAAAKGDADASYAVDAMKKLLDDSKPYVNALTAEEAAQGFELLFDGKDMSKWVGDIEGYAPLNGTINVNSMFGGNLYTLNEYSDFVFRFEFRFLVPGVNNGVGIRTPYDVDAAYFAMCELQILDHDDPIYADLHDYQVHGSIYGVVPAKRLVHKPLGQWSEEEIIVKGNHITVTVNGQVITDADISEACQGHNVAPDGGEYNPYTVDHRNHPGMFNPKGHVSFCGHGQGLQFKNVRILEIK